MRPRYLAVSAAVLSLLSGPNVAGAGTGSQVWSEAGCGGCHTLAAAGATGQGGPDLDQLRPSQAAVATQVEQGGGGMPSFASSLSSAQITAVAAFVSSAAGGAATPASNTSASRAATSSSGLGSETSMAPSAVRHLQITLQRLGFFNGPLTGFYGPLTQTAVASFQRSVGLNADGLFGPKTAAALRRAGPTTGRSVTSPGSAPLPPPARWVRRLQRDLARLGYFHHLVTGVYGPITTAAVRQFQAASGLEANGKWGPQSQAALNKRLAR